MGYQVSTVQPPYMQPRAEASLPVMMILPSVLFIGSMR